MCVVHSFFIRLMQELTSCYPSPHVFHYQQSERYSFVSWTNMVRAAAPTIQLPSYHLRLGPRYYCLQDLLTFIKLTHWQSWTVCRWKMIPVCRVVICDQPHSSYSVLDRLQALAEAPNRLSIQPRHLVRSFLDPAFPYLPLVLRSSSHFFLFLCHISAGSDFRDFLTITILALRRHQHIHSTNFVIAWFSQLWLRTCCPGWSTKYNMRTFMVS